MARYRRHSSGHGLPAALAVCGLVAALAMRSNVVHAAAGHFAAPAGTAAVAWPFPAKDSAQLRRVDEGQDLQYPGTTPVPVRAVAAGRIVILGPDPGGFGDAYPGEVLDHPVTVAGQTFGEIYYGHTFPALGAGTPVHRGDVIAHTGGLHSGGDAYSDPNWLEIGFWPPDYSHGPLMAQWLAGRH